ncbi:MAG TPA: glycosyltransferase family 1 protein [Actinomycetota bacterium]|nr:glycosyltransferase family 1 protein [Actinomycetota bacterium]
MGGPVILDIQAIQNSEYAERGVARHTLEFARALCRVRPDLVGAMVLNPDLPAPAGSSGFAELQATGKVALAGGRDTGAARIYHVIAPFELETGIDRIWPRDIAAGGLHLVVTLHDLIPRVYPEHYHADPGLRRRYLAREELVRAAARVLSVSEATRDEAVLRLGIDPRRIHVIGAGISEGFRVPASREEAFILAQEALPNLQRGFLLYVGGIDHRKNVDGLLRAYALLPEPLRAAHQLVVAFRMPDAFRTRLAGLARSLGIAAHLDLPGYVDDATLIAAYQSTDLFVFPSLYEGYGLPVVEAMACGAPVVSSNAAALVSLTAPEGQFDPTDQAAIAATIERALTDPATAAALRAASERPPPTWVEAAGKAAAVYDELLGAPRRAGGSFPPTSGRNDA